LTRRPPLMKLDASLWGTLEAEATRIEQSGTTQKDRKGSVAASELVYHILRRAMPPPRIAKLSRRYRRYVTSSTDGGYERICLYVEVAHRRIVAILSQTQPRAAVLHRRDEALLEESDGTRGMELVMYRLSLLINHRELAGEIFLKMQMTAGSYPHRLELTIFVVMSLVVVPLLRKYLREGLSGMSDLPSPPLVPLLKAEPLPDAVRPEGDLL
jgi:hypothetical protein